MGTDIHLAAEVRNDKGEWEPVPGPVIDCWSCRGTGIAHRFNQATRQPEPVDEPCRWCTNDGSTSEYDGTEDGPGDRAYYRQRYVEPGKTRDRWYSDRNYVVFSILGNVRNDHGFAGVKTTDPLPYISDCRGIPDDATSETLAVLSDEHSGTWCLLREVMEYQFDIPVHQYGVITLAQYAECKRTGINPTQWSGGISGGNVVTITAHAADAMLANGTALENGSVEYYVQTSWMDSLLEYTAQFRERMRMLAQEVGERECRLIYDFDS